MTLTEIGPSHLHAANAALPLWRRDPPELLALCERLKASEAAQLVEAFGEAGAARFRSLDRARDSVDPRRADEASAEFDALFGTLTAEQERLVYGVGEAGPCAETVAALLRIVDRVSSAWTAREVASLAAGAIRTLAGSDLVALRSGGGTEAAQAAALTLRLVGQQWAAMGQNVTALPGAMIGALVHLGWGEHDAAECVGGFVRDLTIDAAA